MGFSVNKTIVLKVMALSELCTGKAWDWDSGNDHFSPLHVLLESCRTHVRFIHVLMHSVKPGVCSSVRLLIETCRVHVTLRNLFFCHSIRPGTVGKGGVTLNHSNEIGNKC